MDTSELILETERFRVVRRWQTTPDGVRHERHFVEHPGAVVILPIFGEDQVCLIRNRREAVGKTLIELPAGTREPNEAPLETARRELLEETNYRAEAVELLREFYMSPGILNERMCLYVARGLSPDIGHRDPGEQIETFITSFDEALVMAGDGRIEDAKTLVGLLYYDRFGRRRAS